MSTSHADIKLTEYSSPKEDIFRRIKENIGHIIGLPGDSGRIGVRTMCHTRWTIKVPWVASPATARYFDRHRMTPKTSIGTDTVMKVRIRGISSQMNRFRGDEQVDLFWTKVTSKAGAVDVGEPALPRRRKAPFRFDDICCAIGGDFPETTSTKNKFASNFSFGR